MRGFALEARQNDRLHYIQSKGDEMAKKATKEEEKMNRVRTQGTA